VDSLLHQQLPSLKASTNLPKTRQCNWVLLSWNSIWNLGKNSMRERVKPFKHHYHSLRERSKVKNLKLNNPGGLQGSTRSQRVKQQSRTHKHHPERQKYWSSGSQVGNQAPLSCGL